MRRSSYLVAVAFIFYTACLAQAEKGIVLHYTFADGEGDVARDHSGNELHGKIHGAQRVTGDFGSALQFDGVNDYVECAYSPATNTPNTFALEAWVHPTQYGGGVFCRVTGGSWKDLRLSLTTFYRKQKDPYSMFCISNGNKNNRGKRPALVLNTWTHLAVTFDGKVVALYRNGKRVKSFRPGCKANVENVPIWIGRSLGVGRGPYFKGRIADV